MSASSAKRGYMNGRPKLIISQKDTFFRGSFIKRLKYKQIISQLVLSSPMSILMHNIRVSPFIRRFSSDKLEDLVQNSANPVIKLNP
jgi:hypothetical protein